MWLVGTELAAELALQPPYLYFLKLFHIYIKLPLEDFIDDMCLHIFIYLFIWEYACNSICMKVIVQPVGIASLCHVVPGDLHSVVSTDSELLYFMQQFLSALQSTFQCSIV